MNLGLSEANAYSSRTSLHPPTHHPSTSYTLYLLIHSSIYLTLIPIYLTITYPASHSSVLPLTHILIQQSIHLYPSVPHFLLPTHLLAHSLFYSFTHQPLTHPAPDPFTLPLSIYQPTYIPTVYPTLPQLHTHPPTSILPPPFPYPQPSPPHLLSAYPLPTHPFTRLLPRASYGHCSRF